MKTLVSALSTALLVTSSALATDFTLKDGRILRDAVVINADATTVTFRHAEGFTQIAKTKLPETLLTEYPLDAAQSKLETERQQQDAAARDSAAKQLYLERLKLAADINAKNPPPKYEAPKPPTDTSDSHRWQDDYLWSQDYNRRQYEHSRWQHDHGNRDQHRDRNDSTPAPPPNPEIKMTPDIKFGPSVHMVGFDPAPTEDVTTDAAEQPRQPARCRR